MMFKSLSIVFVVCFLLIVRHHAGAQTGYNTNILPLGDHEALIGNTGTGGLQSTGATFYNPAALARIEGNSFSLSGTAYMRASFEATPITNFLGTELSFQGSGFRAIPTSMIMVKTWKKWKIGFSALIPMDFRYEGQESWIVPFQQEMVNIKQIENFQESIFIAGLTLARALDEHWSVGISALGYFYSYYDNAFLKANLENSPTRLVELENRSKATPTNLLVSLGLHRKINRWNVGLRLQMPGLYLFGKGDYYQYELNNLGQTVTFNEIDIQGTPTRFNTPLDIRIGTVFTPADRVRLAMDISYKLPFDYRTYPDTELDNDQVNVEGVFRISGGLEYPLSEKITLSTGGYYLPANIENNTANQKFWSYTAGGRMKTKLTETSIALFYTVGTGQEEILSGPGISEQRYQYLGLLLSTNYTF